MKLDMVSALRNISIALPSLSDEEWEAVREPLLSGWLTQGPKVKEFERNFAASHGVQHAFAVTSCTTGLHLALAAMGIGPGDEVIVPAFTWIATANVVLYCGAKPVFCDVDRETFTLCIQDVATKITDRTKAVIPVHLFGLCADIDALRAILPTHVKILEDAACAAGAFYKGRPAGSLGDAGAFSFHPRKSITTGEGGMVTTHDPSLARMCEVLRNHGSDVPEEVRHYSQKPYILPDFKHMGFNYRMTDIQAAIGIVQLRKLQAFIQQRQLFADHYTKALSDTAWLRPQKVPPFVSQHAWQAYVCYVDPQLAPFPRNEMMDILKGKGIATRPGTHAVHLLSFYKEKYSIQPEDFPNAMDCDHNTMAIPLHNKMTQDDVDYVVEALHAL